ncbi:ceramide synthase-like [Corythoichthys intestinalis]|uniref:ceramide synthase-like n=1 Tax=Corythoichthys intestinalis TaxID=161448 RepID=UPI0025A60536|nr:ceramide synthase-like [Corythoichthys intestinalis]
MLALMLAGALFFSGIFLLSSHVLKNKMGWNRADADIVSARAVSSFQAVMASAAGCVIAAACRGDVVEDRHWLAEAYVAFATPYFLYDVYAMFLCDRHKREVKGHRDATWAAAMGFLRRETLMVFHHVFVVVFCSPASLVWRRGKGDFFQGLLFLAELSTPFVCLAKVLIQLKRTDTLVFKVNGVAALVAFFGCRVVLFPSMYLIYSRYAQVPFYRAVLGAPWPCSVGACVLWPLQIFWFSLMCGHARRSLTGSRATPSG